MNHALIISDNRSSVDILEENLWSAGYHSLMWVHDRNEAWTAVHDRRPNLIVVASEDPQAFKAEDLCRMSDTTGAPIVVATASPEKALHCLGPSILRNGRYPAGNPEFATAATRKPRSNGAAEFRRYS